MLRQICCSVNDSREGMCLRRTRATPVGAQTGGHFACPAAAALRKMVALLEPAVSGRVSVAAGERVPNDRPVI